MSGVSIRLKISSAPGLTRHRYLFLRIWKFYMMLAVGMDKDPAA